MPVEEIFRKAGTVFDCEKTCAGLLSTGIKRLNEENARLRVSVAKLTPDRGVGQIIIR